MSYEASTMNNMRLTYDANETVAYTPIVLPTSAHSPPPSPAYNNPNGDTGENNYALPVTAGIDVSGSDVVKRKRGRPRKYASDGLTPPPAAVESGDFSSPLPSSGKKPRGRPRGSANKQQHAASGKGSTENC